MRLRYETTKKTTKPLGLGVTKFLKADQTERRRSEASAYFVRKASSTTAEMSRRGLPIPRSTPSLTAISSALLSTRTKRRRRWRRSEAFWWASGRARVRVGEVRGEVDPWWWWWWVCGVLVGLAQTLTGPPVSILELGGGWWTSHTCVEWSTSFPHSSNPSRATRTGRDA
jgi:hypothetical protein